MEVEDLVTYMESHDYREWFSNELVKLMHRCLVKARDEGLDIEVVLH
jgi:hypothetical protein